jgi:YfiH family protein
MPFSQQNGLRYFQFDSLAAHHAVFTRHGGVSHEPWASLNVGGTVGDEIEHVRKNRLLSFEAMNCNPESVFDVWQVHSADVAIGRMPRKQDEPYQKADIILTDQSDVTLFMRFADCVPILFHDPKKGVIGIAHAGWLGTVRDVAGETVRTMQKEYNSEPGDIIACIGPSIGPDHYVVRVDVVEHVTQLFEKDSGLVLQRQNGVVHLDLWGANQYLLKRVGVNKIETAEICTACHTEDWFSHRAEKGRTGRFGVLVSLK